MARDAGLLVASLRERLLVMAPSMMRRALLVLLAPLALCACAGPPPDAPSASEEPASDLRLVPPPEPLPVVVTTPSSARSRVAIEGVRPRLEVRLYLRNLPWGSPVFVRTLKREAMLELYVEGSKGYELFQSYPICTFSGTLGPKTRQGDEQAPEGIYAIRPEQLHPTSRYHLAFNLGYPNRCERALGWTGSALMVHGSCVSIGCYAMGNDAIEEIYAMLDAALAAGQPAVTVLALPHSFTGEEAADPGAGPWNALWTQLAKADRSFHATRIPPKTRCEGGRYVVETPPADSGLAASAATE